MLFSLEQWRQEAREHDRQMFGIFCSALTNCNAALNILLKAKQDASSLESEQSTTDSGVVVSRKISKSTDQSSHSSADEKSPSSKDENCGS